MIKYELIHVVMHYLNWIRIFRYREGTDARDAQSGRKLVGISRAHSGELNKGEPVQPGSRSSVKGLKGVG